MGAWFGETGLPALALQYNTFVLPTTPGSTATVNYLGFGRSFYLWYMNPDTLVGTNGRDVVLTGGAEDVLVGLEGDDMLVGGDGSDEYQFGNFRLPLMGVIISLRVKMS